MPSAIANPKTSGTRLLDLLAGWSNYVSSDEEDKLTDRRLRSEEIAALYQEVADLVMPIEDIAAENAAVQSLIQERILPLLLRA